MFSIKKAAVVAAFVSGSQADLFDRWRDHGDITGASASGTQWRVDVGPHGEEILHDSSVKVGDKKAILASEDVNLQKLRTDFAQFTSGTYTPTNSGGNKGPIVKATLDIEGEYLQSLKEEARLLNQEFLANSEYQFAEYLGLTMIQKVFDKSLESKEFISLFESDAPYQQSLDAKLLATYKLVEEKIALFSEKHRDEESKMMKGLLDEFVDMLVKKQEKNGGFPDTEAMRTALFGQFAFRYEQKIQQKYKEVSEGILKDCGEEIDTLLDAAAQADKKMAAEADAETTKDPMFLN